MSRVEHLARHLVRAQDAVGTGPAVGDARARLRAEGAFDRPQKKPRRWWLGIGGAVLAVAAGIALFAATPAPPIEVTGPSHEPMSEGAFVMTTDRPRRVELSDGTSIDVLPESAARLSNTDADGARFVIERGALHAEVHHRPTTQYRFDAGPYRIEVVGTVLDVGWDPSTQRLSVTVQEGLVRVRAESIGLAPIEVAGGHALRAEATPDGWRTELFSLEAPPPEPSIAEDEAVAVAVTERPRRTERGTSEAENAPTWRALADAGEVDAALARVHATGLRPTLATSSLDDLFVLGTLARVAGDDTSATTVFEWIRARHADTPAAATAAFELGRLASEHHDERGAERWLRAYLDEAPSGPLAREAEGRLLEASVRRGAPDREERAARYLERYPAGPHATLAERTLSER